MTDPEGGVTHYTYDTLNRLSNLEDFQSNNYGFGYDVLSRRTSLTRPNSVNTTYAYDDLSHLLSVLHKNGGTTLDGASYTYDSAGNRVTKTEQPASVTSNYSYDNIYQLTGVTQGTSTTESYSDDLVGNRLGSLSVSPYTYNSSNEMATDPVGSYTYDANGNMLTKPDGTAYTWDVNNRLTQVTLPGTGGTVTFKYDPFGRRVQKAFTQGTTTTTTNYVYDGPSLIEEVDSSGSVLARYMQGKSVDEPLAQLRSGTTSYYQQDGLGSVTSLSNSAGAIAETYIYDSYGEPTASTATTMNPIQYTGREFDSETGIYYYRARYFDPGTGRFLSEDRLSFRGGTNFYRYVGNNPLNWIDPSGNKTCILVTPKGGMDVPCVEPGGGPSCIDVPGGESCIVPVPPGPPADLLPPAHNPFCKCDATNLWFESEEIIEEEEAENDGMIPGIAAESAGIQLLEVGAEHAGVEVAPWGPLLDVGLLGRDASEVWEHHSEAQEKLRELFDQCH